MFFWNSFGKKNLKYCHTLKNANNTGRSKLVSEMEDGVIGVTTFTRMTGCAVMDFYGL